MSERQGQGIGREQKSELEGKGAVRNGRLEKRQRSGAQPGRQALGSVREKLY